MDNTYRVTYQNFRWVIVEAINKEEAVKLARECLMSWGYYVDGQPKVEIRQ